MKYFLTILFLCWTNCYATIYYVSNTGDDGQTGTSALQAWQTIAKVNSSSFLPGDQILFKCGDSWNERLIVPASNLIFGAYGTGDKPVLTGFQTLSGFTKSGNVYTATASNASSTLNTVLINDTLRAKSREPNIGYSLYIPAATFTTIETYLSGTPNYAGADFVCRNTAFVLYKVHIASQSGSNLTFTDSTQYAMNYGGNGFFIQNSEYALDQNYEWYYSDTAKTFKVYGDSSNIKIATIDTLVWLIAKSNITFSDLKLEGANLAAFQIDSCNTVTITDCALNNIGGDGINAKVTANLSIISDSITNILNDGIKNAKNDSEYIYGNYLSNIGLLPGMGSNVNGAYLGINGSVGSNVTIENNTVTNTGYTAINFSSGNTTVRNNYVDNYCTILGDGGGIYTCCSTSTGSNISSNIILNGVGNSDGVVSTISTEANGIYLDDNSINVTADSNTIYNAYYGLNLHNNTHITARWNNFYKNRASNFMVHPNGDVDQHLTYLHNAMYNDTSYNFKTFLALTIANIQGSDSNYFSRPSNESKQVRFYTTDYDLLGWQSFSGDDLASVGTPDSVTSQDAILLYNKTFSPVTENFSGTYRDIRGNFYISKIILQPFESAILFKSSINLSDNSLLKFIKIQ